MYVTREFLLAQLPPVRDEWVVIKDDQRVKDIIRELCEAYPTFADDYDRIGCYFEGNTVGDTCDNLYDFCKENLAYREEPEEFQTSALPGGVLSRGFCDCKGYAGFIGGCLGAIGRASGQLIDWNFCFASYLENQPIPYHVFIIVETEQGPVWIDPTPGADTKKPKHAYLRRPDEPATVGAAVDATGELRFFGGRAVGQNTDAATTTKGVMTFAADAMTMNWVGAVQAILPLIQTWLKSYQFTGGDYALGEIFLNRVMDKATTSRWDTPDSVVPIAWLYFSTLFGLPIAVNTDFDSIETGSLATYLAGRPEQRGFVTQDQVTRAKLLFDTLGHTSQQTVPQWPPTSYGLIPYAGPIPDPRIPGKLFTGQLPNGQQVQDGIPVSAAATAGSEAQVPGAPGVGDTGVSMVVILGIAAAAAVLWYFWEE